MIWLAALGLLIELLSWLWPNLKAVAPGSLPPAIAAKLAKALGLMEQVKTEAFRVGVTPEAVVESQEKSVDAKALPTDVSELRGYLNNDFNRVIDAPGFLVGASDKAVATALKVFFQNQPDAVLQELLNLIPKN